MKRGFVTTVTDDSVAYLGLLLLLVLGPLSDVASTSRQGFGPEVRRFLARRAIDGIAAVGWLADRMSGLYKARPAGTGRSNYGIPFTLTR
jgi:hypothetical protein